MYETRDMLDEWDWNCKKLEKVIGSTVSEPRPGISGVSQLRRPWIFCVSILSLLVIQTRGRSAPWGPDSPQAALPRSSIAVGAALRVWASGRRRRNSEAMSSRTR